MSDLATQLKAVESLAMEWREFSRELNGWQTMDYNDESGNEMVRCYFADNRDHTGVTFGNYPHQIQVAFHTPVRFGDFTVQSANNLPAILSECSQLLALQKERFASRSEAETLALKEARIARIKQELDELTGEAA